METLSRYKRQLENTNSRLESELEETKKLMASRDQVSEDACIVITCTHDFGAKTSITFCYKVLQIISTKRTSLLVLCFVFPASSASTSTLSRAFLQLRLNTPAFVVVKCLCYLENRCLDREVPDVRRNA